MQRMHQANNENASPAYEYEHNSEGQASKYLTYYTLFDWKGIWLPGFREVKLKHRSESHLCYVWQLREGGSGDFLKHVPMMI